MTVVMGEPDSERSGVIIGEADPNTPRNRPRRGVMAIVAAAVALTGWAVIDLEPSSEVTTEALAEPEQPFDDSAGDWIPLAFDGSGGFTAVVEGPDGIVAVGTGYRIDSPPFVFHSTDGVEWTEAEAAFEPGDAIGSVVWTPAGYFATGYRPDLDSGLPPAVTPKVWASSDGIKWAEVATTGLPENGTIVGSLFDGTRLTAIGWEGPGVYEPTTPPPEGSEGRIWASDDGREWRDVTPPGSALRFTDVIEVAGSAVICGGAAGRPAVWTPGAEAGRWNESIIATDRANQMAVSLAERESELVAIVRTPADVEGIVTVWSASTDGSWIQIDRRFPPDSSNWVRSIDGTLFAGAGFTRTVFPDGPELWTSESGNRWEGVELTAGVSPWPPTVIAAVSRFEDGLMAFGSRGGQPAAWVFRYG
jgi:hypothetical protein